MQIEKNTERFEKRQRWFLAQRAEKRWINLRRANKDQIDKRTVRRRQRANDISNLLREHAEILPTHRILEIGAGATGIIYFLETEKRYAIEPLAEFIKGIVPSLVNQNVHLIRGIGEELPFGDGSLDVVILDNVLDHMAQPNQALTEINRVLKDGTGILFLAVHAYGSIRKIVRETCEFLRRYIRFLPVDIYHPHTYSTELVREALLIAGFKILSYKSQKHPSNCSDYLRFFHPKTFDECIARPDK